jgi:hypothetical protein
MEQFGMSRQLRLPGQQKDRFWRAAAAAAAVARQPRMTAARPGSRRKSPVMRLSAKVACTSAPGMEGSTGLGIRSIRPGALNPTNRIMPEKPSREGAERPAG